MEDAMRRNNQIAQYLEELSIRKYVEAMRSAYRIEENNEIQENVQQMNIDAARIIDITVKLEGIKENNEKAGNILSSINSPSRWAHPIESLSALYGRMKWGYKRFVEGLEKRIQENRIAKKNPVKKKNTINKKKEQKNDENEKISYSSSDENQKEKSQSDSDKSTGSDKERSKEKIIRDHTKGELVLSVESLEDTNWDEWVSGSSFFSLDSEGINDQENWYQEGLR
ncbi:MAG: hypothetical protein EZS28_010607, partial [Streblomastix strix]